jgi:hypothetical protein
VGPDVPEGDLALEWLGRVLAALDLSGQAAQGRAIERGDVHVLAHHFHLEDQLVRLADVRPRRGQGEEERGVEDAHELPRGA